MVRCKVTGRSRGPSRDHTSLAAVPLRTLSRVFGRVRKPCVDVFSSRGGGGGRGAAEGWYAGNVFLGSHGATPLPLPLASLSLPLPSVGRTATRARARPTPNTQRARIGAGWRERGDRWRACVASE